MICSTMTMTMTSLPNLAGDPGCDVHAMNELRRAEIQAHEGELMDEVPSRVCGRLGPIVFRRAWRYWIARGPVPVAVAEDIYAAPAGRAVRVNGDGMTPAPEGAQIEWRLPDGALVVPTDEEAEFRRVLARFPQTEGRGPLVFNDDPRALGAMGYVPLYHVDSQEGLGLFARVLRQHGLHEVARPPWWDRFVETGA
jgi:hypothetical protein